MPALPVLAAIPTTVPEWGPLLMLAPVALGVLAGRIRWGRDLPTVTGAAAAGAGLAGVVAGLVAALVLLASGSLGGDRLAVVGPRLLPVAGAAAGLTLLGFLGEAGFQSLRLSWELHLAEQRRLRDSDGAPADIADPDDPRAADRDPADRAPGSRRIGTGRVGTGRIGRPTDQDRPDRDPHTRSRGDRVSGVWVFDEDSELPDRTPVIGTPVIRTPVPSGPEPSGGPEDPGRTERTTGTSDTRRVRGSRSGAPQPESAADGLAATTLPRPAKARSAQLP